MDLPGSDAVLPRPATTEGHPVRSRRYPLYLLAAAVVYVLLFVQAIPTFVDEAATFRLATDSSLSHMFSALRGGADGSFPLYALNVYAWGKIFGSSELSLRLNSGLFVLLFIWHMSRRLDRCFGLAPAIFSLLFVLSNKLFAYYALQARFYGLVIFLFSLGFWSSWELLQNQKCTGWQRLRHALFCGLLCLSHPLGLVYTGILAAAYLLCSVFLKRLSFGNSLAFLGGPILFLLWLPSFLDQRLVSPTYAPGPPGWHRCWQFAFFDSLALFLTLLAGLVVFLIRRWVSSWAGAVTAKEEITEAKGSKIAQLGNAYLVVFSLVLVAGINGTFALLDAAKVIPVYWMEAVRYLIVGWVAYAVILSAIAAAAAGWFRELSQNRAVRVPRIIFALPLAGLLLLMESHWGDWFKARASDRAYFSKISGVASERHLDVVCKSHWDAFYLATRTPTARVFYLLEDDFPFKQYLLKTAIYYPNPFPICPPGRLHYTNAYLYLTDSPREARIIEPAP